ncbi:hypothetical protein FQA39_LY08189 [Lamprigera yunnana]|nr:hypothetical protein FQA39_LY08189 [Lamprigera yunnana]
MELLEDRTKIVAIVGTYRILTFIINIIMFFVGILSINKCPIEPKIPFFLAVAGGVGIITKVLPMINYKFIHSNLLDTVLGILVALELIWMIIEIQSIVSLNVRFYAGGEVIEVADGVLDAIDLDRVEDYNMSTQNGYAQTVTYGQQCN